MAVVCVSNGTFRVEISTGGHELVADEAERLGGTDSGPDPFDLVMAALGSCTAVTIVDAARERGLSVDLVRVNVSARPSKRPESPGDPELSLAGLQRSIEIEGDLRSEDRHWLYERGVDCAVCRSLSSGIPIATRIDEPGAGSP